jgi:phage antirepressor YoqD-like protein
MLSILNIIKLAQTGNNTLNKVMIEEGYIHGNYACLIQRHLDKETEQARSI